MLASALLALMLAAPADETIQVQKTNRLDVQSSTSEVDVVVWNRDAVRVATEPPDASNIQIRTTAQSVLVQAVQSGRRAARVTITVPAWMAVRVLARRGDVTLTGVGGEVAVETISGDILVRGGAGQVYAKSLQGSVAVENARARVEARSVNSRVRVADVTGDIEAASTNGSIALERITAMKVEAETVNGSVSFQGTFDDHGEYQFSTHNGSMSLVIPEKTNATLRVKTYQGTFRSTFPVRLNNGGDRGRPMTMTIGSGGADVDLESFNGSISLRRPEDPAPAASDRSRSRSAERSTSRESSKDKNK